MVEAIVGDADDNFLKGLNTKTDGWQLNYGNMETLRKVAHIVLDIAIDLDCINPFPCTQNTTLYL